MLKKEGKNEFYRKEQSRPRLSSLRSFQLWSRCCRSPYTSLANVFSSVCNVVQSMCTTILRPRTESSWRGESRSAWSSFVKFIFDFFFQNNFQNNVRTLLDQAESESPRRILVCRGLRPFWGASVCKGIERLVSPENQADLCALNNIVFAHTSNSLVQTSFFFVFFESPTYSTNKNYARSILLTY